MYSEHILKHNLLTKLALAATLSLGFVTSTNIAKPNVNTTVQAAQKGDIKDGKFHYLYKNHKSKMMAEVYPGQFYVYNYKGDKINVQSWDESEQSDATTDNQGNLMNGFNCLNPNGYRYINGEKYWHLKGSKDDPIQARSLYMKASNFNAKTNKLYGYPGYVLYQTNKPIKSYLEESPDNNGHVKVTDEGYAETIPAGGMLWIDASPDTTDYKRETNKDVVYAATDGRYDLTHHAENIMIKKSDWNKYVHVAPDNARYYEWKVTKGYMTNGLLKKGYIVSAYTGKN